jgi:hypothetical protein
MRTHPWPVRQAKSTAALTTSAALTGNPAVPHQPQFRDDRPEQRKTNHHTSVVLAVNIILSKQ